MTFSMKYRCVFYEGDEHVGEIETFDEPDDEAARRRSLAVAMSKARITGYELWTGDLLLEKTTDKRAQLALWSGRPKPKVR